MHNFDLVLNLVGSKELVGFLFSGCEDDSLALAAVANQNICESRDSVVPGNVNGQVLNRLGSFVF